jgi:hypothetical protein
MKLLIPQNTVLKDIIIGMNGNEVEGNCVGQFKVLS